MLAHEDGLQNFVDKSSLNYLFYTLIGYNFITGFYLAGVTSLYPEMEELLDLSNAVLGDLIATSILGIGLAIYMTPYILAELGSANSTLYSTIVAAAGLVVYGFASLFGEWMLILGINIVGFSFVWLVGACNTQVSLLELVDGRPYFGFMQGVHALGVLVGALFAAGLSEVGVTVYAIDIIFAIVSLVVILIPFPFYIRHDAEIRLELHREGVKEKVERERQRLLNNNHHHREHNSDSDSSSSSSSSNNNSNGNSRHNSLTQFQAHQDTTQDDPEVFPSSDSERDAFLPDKEQRPLLRSRIHSTSNSALGNNASNPDHHETRNLNASRSNDNVYGTVHSHHNSSHKPKREELAFWQLNFIMVCAGLGSGVAISWSQVYVLQDWSTSETVATLGYVGFQLGAAISRFSSDYLFSTFTRKELIVYGSIGAALGTLASALSCLSRTDATLGIAVGGFIVTGFFFGPIYPAVLSYATTLRGYPTGEAIPVVKASTLIAGMVIAPLVYGNIIDIIGYMSSFLIQVVIYLLGFVCAWYLRSDRHHHIGHMSPAHLHSSTQETHSNASANETGETATSSPLTQEQRSQKSVTSEDNNNSGKSIVVMTSDTPVAANLST